MACKRENSNVVISASAIVLDIEGTTTSISFVKDVLFPYVRSHLKDYVEKNWDSAECKEITKALRLQAKDDKEKEIEGVILIPESEEKETVIKAVVDNILWQMDNDRKTKALKDLQGLIMEEGYNKEELKGHIYDDVASNIKSWAEQDKAIYIYSSGSVHAQKLLFGHSVKGDLLPFIKGHFDTTVGMKGEVESYKNILEKISCDPAEVVFLTDIPKEAAAAKDAGVYAILVSRDGNAPLTEEDEADFPVISSFSEVEFENSMKRRKLSDVSDENKDAKICEVSKDEKPDNPKPISNGGVEMMEIEESSEKEFTAVSNNENVKSDILVNKEADLKTEKAEEVILPVPESVVEHKTDSKSIEQKTLPEDIIQPDKVEQPLEKVEKSVETNVMLDKSMEPVISMSDTKNEPKEEVMALDVQSDNNSDKPQETHVKSDQSGTMCNDANKGTEKITDATSEVISETNDSKKNQESSDIKIKPDDETKTEMSLVSIETNSALESNKQGDSAMEMETKPESTDANEETSNPKEKRKDIDETTVPSEKTDHPVEKQEDDKLMHSSDNEPVSTEEPVKKQTSEAEVINKVDEVSKDKVNQESCVELPNESQMELKQTDVSTEIDSTTSENIEKPAESLVAELIDPQQVVPKLSEQKLVTKAEEVPKIDEETKDGTHETETIDTSQDTGMNRSVKETNVDIDNKEMNVPSDTKTEITDGNTPKSHDGEDKTVNNITEVAQNCISNGHCTEKVNGASSPSNNGELSPENQAQAIETKKCVDSSENTPTETIVEA